MATTATKLKLHSLRDARPELPGLLGALVAAPVVAIVLVKAFDAFGPLVVTLPLLVGVAVWLVNRPEAALWTLVGTTVLFEDDPEGFLGSMARWYDYLPGLPILPSDLVLLLLIVGMTIELVRSGRRPRLPFWALVPGPVLAAALVGGAITGYLAGPDYVSFFHTVESVSMLIVVPLVAAVTIDHFNLVDRTLRVATGLVLAKSVAALIAWFLGVGRAIEGTTLTYYSPTMNNLCLIYVLGVVAWRLRTKEVPRLVLFTGVVATASLVLSFRRSFWIALVLGLLVTVVVASGRRGRPWVLLVGAVVIAGVSLTLSVGGATNSENPVVDRARIRNTAEDRYRLEEQANVFEEIERHPLTGLGIGVPWKARHPLSLEFSFGRGYTHVVVFWYWLKLGPLGVLGYFLVIVSACALGWRVWRYGRPELAAAGLAIAVGEVARAVAETTGSFTGANGRFTIGHAIVLGWLSAAALAVERESAPRPDDGVLAGAASLADPDR